MNGKKLFWVILGVAFLVRVTGLGYGLPFLYHQDEPIMVNHAMAIGATGDWNPHFFTNGSLSMYLLFFLYGGLFLFMKLLGQVAGAYDFGILFLKDPTSFYILGRFVLGVLAGTLTVGWLMSRASKLFRVPIGLFAGLFLALCYFHVQNSHYIWSDIPLTLAASVLFFQLLTVIRKPSALGFCLAGVAWGVGLACKMTAAFLAPTLLFALILSAKGQSADKNLKNALSCGFGALSAFFICSPFAILDWKTFLAHMILQKNAETVLSPGFHFVHSLLQGVGPLTLVLSFLGIVPLLKEDKRSGVLTVFFVATFYLANSFTGMPFARRVLPLAPILCFLAAWGWVHVSARLSPGARRLGLGIVLAASLAPIFYSDALFFREDTRTQAFRWVTQNVPPGTVLVTDNRFFSPHLTQPAEWIESKKELLETAASETYITSRDIDKVRAKRLDMMQKANEGKPAYRVYALSTLKEGKDLPLFMLPILPPVAGRILEEKTEYLIFNYAEYREDFHVLKNAAGLAMERVASFSPYRSNAQQYSLDSSESTAAPHGLKELFSRKSLGPYLEIYRVKQSG